MTNLQSIALAELSLAMAAIRQNNSVKAAEYALSAVRTLETGGCGGCGAVFYSTDGAEPHECPCDDQVDAAIFESEIEESAAVACG